MKQILLLALGLMFIASCQSSHLVKPQNFPQAIDQSRQLTLMMGANEPFQLEDIYKEHRGVVAIFWQVGCNCVQRYQKRINNLFERYSPQGVAFLHVSSNQNEDFAQVQQEYERRGIGIPLVRDVGGRLAKALNVRGTPAAVLINQSGNIEYLGWIDNERDETESGRQAYLEQALNEFLAGTPVSIKSTPMWGCKIH